MYTEYSVWLFLFSQLFPFDYEQLCCCINITAWHNSFFFFLACLWRICYVNTFKGKILLFTIKIPIVIYIFQNNITIGKKQLMYCLFSVENPAGMNENHNVSIKINPTINNISLNTNALVKNCFQTGAVYVEWMVQCRETRCAFILWREMPNLK